MPSAPRAGDGNGAAEALRALRANLEVALTGFEHPIVMTTSSLAAEGKTTTCVSLALAMAAIGRRVSLVDLDLRDPSVHRVLGAHNTFGVTDVLLGRRPLAECNQRARAVFEGLTSTEIRFLAAGAPVSNPGELIASSLLPELLAAVACTSDVVFVDAPPVLPVSDAVVLGRLVTGTVLVAEAGRVELPALRSAQEALARGHSRLFGVVLNRCSPQIPVDAYVRRYLDLRALDRLPAEHDPAVRAARA